MGKDIDKRAGQPPAKSSTAEVDAFRRRLAAMPAVNPAGGRGRLLFAMDATASRQPTWDRAQHLQGEMFSETAALGGLDVQLVYFRGFGECRASPWVSDSARLLKAMTSVSCLGGQTQIGRVFAHGIGETKRRKINALVYVGDCMEEDVDALAAQAGELGMLGVPVFVFHEGDDPAARAAFQQFAKLSGGAYCRFDSSSAASLRELLSAVAVYASGGRKALADYAQRAGGEVRLLARQMAGTR
jgi:hypothetical protein